MMGEHIVTFRAKRGLVSESVSAAGSMYGQMITDNELTLSFTVKKTYYNWPFLCSMMRRLVDDDDIADLIIHELRYENAGYDPDEAAGRMADICMMLFHGASKEKLISIIEQRHEYQEWSNIVANILNDSRYDVALDSQSD